uniref:E3 ubiquitin ligase n=1 Tax=Rhipicephalus zambeziensis TaxID=60191 RepID=A0A224YWD4_9ACAR
MGGRPCGVLVTVLLLPWVRADLTQDVDEYYTAVINLTYVHPTTGQLVSEREELGRYYSAGKLGSVSGVVVHVTSGNFTAHDACSPLDAASIPQEPWIALIQHGNCVESVKMRHAANTNASGAVLYSGAAGPGASGRLLKMRHKVSQLISVLIGREKGQQIAGLVDNGTRVVMQMSVGSHRPFPYPSINRTSVLFVSVSFIILMIISLAWLVFYYVQRFRYIHAKDLLARRLCSAAQKALDRIPVQTLRPGEQESECCAVCIEPLRPGELVRLLPCRHSFHKPCVDPWLLEQRSCPMCKMDILKHYGLVVCALGHVIPA